MPPPPFERSVFINCPFDDEFAPILQAIAFCVVYLGFYPRIAPENADNGAVRLERIVEIAKGSKYGIHDLSRCKSTAAGQFYRLNMPFELGIDHACARFGAPPLNEKTILILEKTRYDYQKALSDIAGWDIEAHDADFEKAIKKVRNWLVQQAGATPDGPSRILGKYNSFQAWNWERQKAAGASDDDIKEYPTSEIIAAMHLWIKAGQPDAFVA